MTKVNLLTAGILCFLASAQFASADSVKDHLAGYHLTATPAQLEQIAGGESALISQLLTLRHDQTHPFVAVRAVKLLVANYSGEVAVQNALQEDMQSKTLPGLARALTLHLEKASPTEFKRSLAHLAVARASEDPSFAPYVRELKNSRDDIVRQAALGLK